MELMIPFFKAVNMLEEPVQKLMEEMSPPPSCLISDMCLFYTSKLAKTFNIPKILFHGMCCFCLLCMHVLRENLEILESLESDKEYFTVPYFPDKVEFTRPQVPVETYVPGEWKEFLDEIKEADKTSYGVLIFAGSDRYCRGASLIGVFVKTDDGCMVWPVEVDLNFLEPVGKELKLLCEVRPSSSLPATEIEAPFLLSFVDAGSDLARRRRLRPSPLMPRFNPLSLMLSAYLGIPGKQCQAGPPLLVFLAAALPFCVFLRAVAPTSGASDL
ncbi:hypothetical protein Bca52824_049271 [Brassica carinata]|uniref:Uncharacterized protein n=1 Tax=Brassica carinata TaxID=52824 RepID=A0A8X7USW3_BRACI|nr:hypothetical protein Bca52824_049271 [Brassica carinata]